MSLIRNFRRMWLCVALSVLTTLWGMPLQALAEETPVKPVIVIDAGHGGVDGGAQTSDGSLLEKTLNLEIAKKLKQALVDKGFQVYMTREDDSDATVHSGATTISSRHRRDLMGRVEFAKRHGAILILSIHSNTGTKTNRGPLVICQPESHVSVQTSELIQKHFNQLTGMNQHVVKGKKLYLLSHSQIPVVLVEVGFLSNPSDVLQLRTGTYQNRLVECLVAGVTESLLTGMGQQMRTQTALNQ